MRSAKLTTTFWSDYCQKVFPNVNLFPFSAAEGSNVIFTNGSEDPWQWASLRLSLSTEKYESIQAVVSVCNDCAHSVDFTAPTQTQATNLTEVQAQIASTI